MKKRAIFGFTALVFLIMTGCGQQGTEHANTTPVQDTLTPGTSVAAVAADTALLINAIRTEFDRINKASLTTKQYNWKSVPDCEPSYMEGTAIYYYDNGTLVKIHEEGGEDHGEWKQDYYFKNGRLIFIFMNNAYGGASNPTEYKYQNRYYFNSDSMVKKLESVDPPFNLEPEKITGLIQTANRLYQAKDSTEISKILSCG